MLDPLTGERLKFWNDEPIIPEAFILEILDLIAMKNPPTKKEAGKNSVAMLSEEEQLRLALQISANGDESILDDVDSFAPNSSKIQDPKTSISRFKNSIRVHFTSIRTRMQRRSSSAI